jgi:outer membrane protein OmpA-like peptidoglycan-associated protein
VAISTRIANKAASLPKVKGRETGGLLVNPLRANAALIVQRTLGNASTARLARYLQMKAELTVGAPGDRYEREADAVADRAMATPEPAVQRQELEEEEEPKLQRQVEEQEPEVQAQPEEEEEEEPEVQAQVEEEEEPIQPQVEEEEEPVQAKGEAAPVVTAQMKAELEASRGSGAPLSRDVRAFMEPRLGRDFSTVRVPAGARAAGLAKGLRAQAFTRGADVYFAAGKYAPATAAGKRLLAHELAHFVQNRGSLRTGGGDVIRRRYAGKVVRWRREYKDVSKIPKTFNYELIEHKLWAHNVARTDLDQIRDLIYVFYLYSGETKDKTVIAADLLAAWNAATGGKGGKAKLNVTPFLPKSVRRYLKGMQAYFEAYRKYIRDTGFRTPDDVSDYYEKQIKAAKKRGERAKVIALEKKADKEFKKWVDNQPTTAEEYPSACHELVMLITAGSPTGTVPERYAEKAYGGAFALGLKKITGSYKEAIRGRGPYRVVTSKAVRIGDIAVFQARRARPRQGVDKGMIVHSAVVIAVSGRRVELLEKKDPREPMATRTVAAVKRHYRPINPKVFYLTPALAGMPVKSPRRLGAVPPTGAFLTATGTAPADTHVLFEVNTSVTRPHEDRKLFEFVNRHKSPILFNVHGYASEEGRTDYNLNLSAHRAVDTKKALEARLPVKSTGNAFARGETTAFGSGLKNRPKNRRAGIEVPKKPPPPAPVIKGPPAAEKETGFKFPYVTYSDLPKLQLDPRFLKLPPLEIAPTPDYFKLAEPFRKRGYALAPKYSDDVLELWNDNYQKFRRWGGMTPGYAKLAADFATAFAFDQHLYLQRPTPFELHEQKWSEQPTMLKIDLFDLFRVLQGE